MYTSISQLARSRYVDAKMLKKFAVAQAERFGLVERETNDPLLGTWYVNELMDAFKSHLGDKFQAHRDEQIALQRAQGLKTNPVDRDAALKTYGDSYLEWARSEGEAKYGSSLDALKAKIDDIGYEHVAEWLNDSMADFTVAFSQKIMPVYNFEYVEFAPVIDKWVYENIQKPGLRSTLLAISVSYGENGVNKVLDIVEGLRPTAQENKSGI